MTTTTETTDTTYEDEYECDDEPSFTDENGKEWITNVFLINISNLVLNEDCELTDGIKDLIKSHLCDNYTLIEIDYNDFPNEDQCYEILYDRLTEEFGDYVEDWDAETAFQTYGDYQGNYYDKLDTRNPIVEW